jgi:ABC-type nitrate/sulfonate/bicarbonate transport system substrate-binding protein
LIRDKLRTRALACVAGAAALACAHAASAQTKLTVIVFPGLQNLPIFAAQENGFFAKRGINLDLRPTPNSEELRNGLAEGRYDLAHSAVDNAVAMAEHAKVDVVVLMGGDDGFNNMYVSPDIKSYADLKGKTLAVDALDTAYAFQLYAILKMNGVPQGSYTAKPVGGTPLRLKAMQAGEAAAAMMNPPFSIVAEKTGVKKMASATQVLGAYQGNSAFALRTWAPSHRETIEHYIQAYVEGLRWMFNPANKDKSIAMLKDRLKLDEDVAAKAYAVGVEGMAKDAKIDMAGFQNVLKLRAEMHGDWGGKPPSPDKYLDLSYYNGAMKGL